MNSCGGRLVSKETDEWWKTKRKKHVTDERKLKVNEKRKHADHNCDIIILLF